MSCDQHVRLEHIREEIVAATLEAARTIATEGLGEKQPAHGFLFIIGDSKELLDPDPDIPFAQTESSVHSKYGFFPRDLDRRDNATILIQQCCESDSKKRALQTLCSRDNAIVVDGDSGQVCCGGFANRDSTTPYGTGSRTRAASSIAVNANCVSIKASEDICGTRANPVAPDAKLEVFRGVYFPEKVPLVVEEAPRAVSGNAPPSLESQLRPLSFNGELKWHVEQFVPGTRDWILNFLISWVRNTDGPRCCVLFAGPGFGKTAIVAQLYALLGHRAVIAVHLIQHNNAAKRDPCRMIKSLAYQIARALPAYRKLVEEVLAAGSCDLNDIAQLFDCLLLEPLASIELPADGRLLIVIDALDEAEHATKNDLLDLIARDFPKLPARVAVLVTSRRDLKARSKLSTLRPKVLDSEENAEECANDVRQFLRAILAPVVEPERLEATINTAAAKAQGVFLYIYWLRKRLENESCADMEALPDGLAGAYLAQFTRVFPGGFSIDGRKVLGAILAAPVPPHTKNTLPRLSGVPRCKDIVGLLSQLFPVRDDGCVYSFHKSIPDWLMGEFPYEDRSDEDPYFIDRVDAHRRAAAACVAALLREHEALGNVNESDAHAAAVIREEWSGAGDDERDLYAPDDYALRWAITHLVEAKLRNVALALLCSMHFVTLRVEAGHMAELIADSIKVPGAEATLLRRALVLSQNHVGLWGCAVLAEELWQRVLEPAENSGMMAVSRLARDARRMARGMGPPMITARHASLTPADTPLHCVLEGHEGGVNGVTAFKTSDGEPRLASCSDDQTVRVWDPIAGRELSKLGGHQHRVLGVVSFETSDGTRLLASSSHDRTLRVWDLNAGVELRKLEGHQDWVLGVTAFEMNDTTCLASCSVDKTVRVWDPMTGRELCKLEGHQEAVNGVVAFKMNNTMCLASCSDDTTVRVWNPIEVCQLCTLEGHQNSVKSVVAFEASDGPRLASGSELGMVRIWNPIDACQVHEIDCGLSPGMCVAAFATSDGTWLLAIGSYEWTVRIWNPFEGQELNKLEGHDGSVCGLVAFELSEGVLRLASCSLDGTVRIWDPIASGRTSELETHENEVYGLAAFSTRDDEPRLASCSLDRTVRVWDPSSRSELQKLEGHRDPVCGVVAFKLNDAICLASCSYDGTVRVWDPTSGRELHKLEGHSGPVDGVTVFKMNEEVRLASCSYDKTLRVWDLTEGCELLKVEGHQAWVRGVVAFEMNDEVRLASCSDDKTVRVWDPTTGRQLHTLDDHEHFVFGVVAFEMNDVVRLASCSFDKTVRVWDMTTARQLLKLEGHQSWVCSVGALAATNKTPRLASSSYDVTVRLWDPIAGAALFVLSMEKIVKSMTVFEMKATGGDDQKDIVCAFGHHNGTITYWDVRF
ncbi:hypothetical protein CTAYLR_008203 [Chrysophaeum taylorii]|uniref:Nephrocystin 3-like N-terminal domain-containing protein n=1 Tax=Chrysophaeum taylorii TaxID=2483200 RepID=A0AAD7UA22_9STRA|nr:hypothetical protein CTAYLR_008203 [Chrysophaeum taylorii]